MDYLSVHFHTDTLMRYIALTTHDTCIYDSQYSRLLIIQTFGLIDLDMWLEIPVFENVVWIISCQVNYC